MNPSVVFVRERDPVAGLPMLFAEHDDPVVIVTDEDCRPVGVVRAGQLLRAAVQQTLAVRVQELGSEKPFCLRVDAPLVQALDLFASHGAREIAVVGENGKLIGVLLPQDVLRLIAQQL
jgi:predicted transcriptional regulator